SYTVYDLVDAAASKGIHCIAVTPHGRVFYDRQAQEYAAQKGVLLIFGIEKRVEGKEVLILNVVPEEIPSPMTFADLRSLRLKRGGDILVVAPHPFYPAKCCMGDLMETHADLMDGIEYAHLHLPFYNPNDRAVEWSIEKSKPILANSDTHHLFMFGRNYTEVDSPDFSIRSIFQAIRERKTRAIVHRPTFGELIRFVLQVTFFQGVVRKALRSRRRLIQSAQI
ncbi:MAG: PHP domain-containing protein, partial [Verrucomicrobiota bacterium]